MKAVRDVWNLRTWTSVTRPFWTPADQAFFLRKRPRPQRERRGSMPHVPVLRRSLSTEQDVCGLRLDALSEGLHVHVTPVEDVELRAAFNTVEHAVWHCWQPSSDELAGLSNMHGCYCPYHNHEASHEAYINSSSGRGGPQQLRQAQAQFLTQTKSDESEQQDIWEIVTQGLHIETQRL